jgi:hypothetical protein
MCGITRPATSTVLASRVSRPGSEVPAERLSAHGRRKVVDGDSRQCCPSARISRPLMTTVLGARVIPSGLQVIPSSR